MYALWLSFLLIVLDQATKFVVHARFELGEGIHIIPGFFDIRYIQNTGAAFGIMEGMNPWLVALSIVMLGLLVGFRSYFLDNRRLHRVVLALMVAGIIGNLIDRIKFGYVIDFLYFYWNTHDFPAFNLADSSICVGVALYMLSQFILKPVAAHQPADAMPGPGAVKPGQ